MQSGWESPAAHVRYQAAALRTLVRMESPFSGELRLRLDCTPWHQLAMQHYRAVARFAEETLEKCGKVVLGNCSAEWIGPSPVSYSTVHMTESEHTAWALSSFADLSVEELSSEYRPQ